MKCRSLAAGEGLRVTGPARIVVEEGCVYGSGYTMGPGEEALVRAERGFTFYACSGGARLCVHTGAGASVSPAPRSPVVEAWSRLVEELREAGVKRIVVAGPPESGKSTLAAWLVNGLGLSVVEADVGQNELGVPGFVCSARPRGRILVLQDAEPEQCLMVGHVSAEKVMDLVVASASILARQFNAVVVDTDGYVEGRGVFYKAALAEAVDADAVVVLGDPWLTTQLRGLGLSVYQAPRVPEPRERSRRDRRMYRSRLWARLFAAQKPVVLEDVELLGLCPFEALEDGILYRCGSDEIEVARRRPQPPRRWLRRGWEKGLLAAAVTPRGHIPLLVESLDPLRGRAVARPARGWSLKSVNAVVLGWIKLHEPDYREEHLRPGLLPLPLVQRRRPGSVM